MARNFNYTKIEWQDGTILQPAKVTVQGTEYEVEPEVKSGQTPIDAINLDKMDSAIETIIEEELPSVINVELLAVTDVAPTECSTGDKYYNTEDKKIYTATEENTWSSTGETPLDGILYVLFDARNTFAWDGTDLISVGGGGGVYVGTEPPEDDNVNFWVNPDDNAPYPDFAEMSVDKLNAGNIEVGNIESKNLFNVNDAKILNAYFNDTETYAQITSASTTRTIYIPCNPNTTYTISKISSARFYIGYTTERPTVQVQVYNRIGTTTGTTSLTITTGNDAKYLCAFIYHSSYDTTITLQEILDSIQIEKGDTATAYTPYIAFNNDFNAKVVYRNVMFSGQSDTYTFPNENGLYLLIAQTNGDNHCIMDVIMKAVGSLNTTRIKAEDSPFKTITYSTTTVTMNNTNYTGIYSIIKLY